MTNQYPEAFRAYLQALNKSAHTVKQYVNDAKQFEKYLDEEHVREQFPAAVKAYIAHIYQNYQTANSINRKLAALRSYCAFLYSRKYIKAYDESLFERQEVAQTKLVALTDDQMRSVLRCWDNMYDIAQTDEHAWIALRNLAITYTLAKLGIKPAELVKMKWSHIIEESMKVTILERETYRVLDLPKELLDVLQRYKKYTVKQFEQLPQLDDVWLGVGNKLGEPITVKTIERVFLHLSKLVGFKVTCTALRYTVIEKDMQELDDKELYAKFGYARNGVLKERYKRLKQEQIK